MLVHKEVPVMAGREAHRADEDITGGQEYKYFVIKHEHTDNIQCWSESAGAPCWSCDL